MNNKLSTGLLVLVAVISLGACSVAGADDADDRPRHSRSGEPAQEPEIANGPGEQPQTTAADASLNAQADPSEGSEFDSANPLAGIRDQVAKAAPDPQTGRQGPPDGTQMWGRDGCLWTVVQGYWLQTGACAVPDVSNQTIYYLYPFGSVPALTWFAEVSVDPALTANGAYFVYYLSGGTNWLRCHTDCTNITNYEVFVVNRGWWTYAQITTGYQQMLQRTQQQTMTLTIGGQSPALTQANSSLLQRQGAPAGSSLTMEEWDFFRVINDQINRTALNSLGARCTYTARGC